MVGRRSFVVGLAVAGWSLPLRGSAATSGATLTVEPIDAERGEDGAGRTLDADAPHALVLRSDAGWPARALDPVLRVGDLHFHDYVHVDRTTLRFVVDDVSRLHPGDAVSVQYGDDTRSRVRLADLEKSW